MSENPKKKIAKWSCCNNCDQFKNKKCCGGDIYYPTSCPEHIQNGVKTSDIMEEYDTEHDIALQRELEELNNEILEANNLY